MAGERVMLSPPLKRTDKVALSQPLRNFIYSTYGQDADTYKEGIADLEQAREKYCVQIPDKHESAVEGLMKYYDQLVAIEGKLPFGESQINVRFTWYDCLKRKEGLFSSSSMKCAMNNGAYERLCVLYNIAALQGRVAASQNLDTDVGLKLACKYFASSAGIFLHLRDQVFSQLTKTPSADLSSETLSAFSALMLAQAQESFFVKASMDRMKPAVVAKVAAQAADYCGEALKAMENSAVAGLWDKSWLPVVRAKQPFFVAMADYHQSLVEAEQKKFGEQISRLQHAHQMLSVAAKHGEGHFVPQTSTGRIAQELTSAKKENELIYNAFIPDYSRLPELARFAVAKATAVPAHPMSGSSFKDSFEGLVPLQIHEAVSAYEQRRTAFVHGLVGRLKEGTAALNAQLASMNLPAAIEDTTGTEVPQSLLEKSATVRSSGGLQKLEEQLVNLPGLLERNEEILGEVTRILDEEEREDTQLRERFKEKWNRVPSAKLTEQFRQEVAKYTNFLHSARAADAKVRAKFDEHRSAMEQLCLPEGEFAGSIPAGGPSLQTGSQVVLELQNLMAQVTQMKTDREKLEQSVEEMTFDVRSKFMSALVSDGALNEEAMSEEILDNVYGSFKQDVEGSMQRQDELMARVQDCHGRFEQEKQSGGAVSQREHVLKALAAGHDVFVELTANLTEGTKFYANLTELLLKFQQKVSDLIFARNTEKEDVLKDIQQTIAHSGNEPAPAQPAYQQQGSSKAPPGRPPPPQFSSAAAKTAPVTSAPVVPARPTPAPRSQPPPAAASIQLPPAASAPPATHVGMPPATQPSMPSATHAGMPAATQPGMPPVYAQAPAPAYGYPVYPPPGQYYMPPAGAPPPQGQPGPQAGMPAYGQPASYGYPAYQPPAAYPYPPYQAYPGYQPPPGGP